MQSAITSVLESLSRSELDEVKRRIQDLSQELKSERDRGALFAATGIYSSISRSKDRTLQEWDPSKIERAAKSITSNQLSDDFDAGYAEALVAYAKLTASSQQSAE